MLQKGVNLTPKLELEKGGCRLYNKSMTSIKLSENGGKAPEAVPYMPAGLNEICCTVNGRAGKRTVMVDAAACERLNADLQEQIKAHQAGGRARPVILFDHKAGAAAAVPTGFEWDEKRGILLRVEWTQAGRAAVEGGNYAYISPAFKLAPQSESITGLQDGVEVGSLVNDPAFTRNECIAAAREVVEDVQVWAANPYGCNQHGHEFKALHGEGWKPRVQSRDSGKEEGKQTKADDNIDKEVDDYLNGTDDERWVKITQWNAGVRKAKDEALDIRESTAYRKGDPEAIKRYNEAKEKANTAAQRRRSIVKKAGEKRGYSGKKLDTLLRHFPETVIASNSEFDEDLTPFCDIEKNTKEGDNIRAANNGSEKTTENKDMETVKKQLGLDADATPADVAAAIAALKKKSEAGQKRIEEVEAECNEHKKALQEHKEKAADGFIERLRKGGKVAQKDEETLKAAREMYMENPERTERIYAAMQPICPPEEGEGDMVQANRVPSGDTAKMSVADFYAGMDF